MEIKTRGEIQMFDTFLFEGKKSIWIIENSRLEWICN